MNDLQKTKDLIKVTFEDGSCESFEAAPLLELLKNASTRRPERLEHNIKDLESTLGKYQAEINAFLDLPYASQCQPLTHSYSLVRSPSQSSLGGDASPATSSGSIPGSGGLQ